MRTLLFAAFNPFYSISERISNLSIKAMLFASISIVCIQLNLELSKIPFLNLDTSSLNKMIPASAPFSILAFTFLVLFLINYAEECLQFQQDENIKVIENVEEFSKEKDSSDNINALIDYHYRRNDRIVASWKVCGQIQTSVNLLLPVILTCVCLYLDSTNIKKTITMLIS